MRSFDLFNTLVASRFVSPGAGEAPLEDHIPIAENIAKVTPDDLVISDYHTPEKARAILHEVAKLNNKLIVTEDGKSTGAIWKNIRPESHLGDNQHSDYDSPLAAGIPATRTDIAALTQREKQFGALGLIVREARLKSWNANPMLRALQLYQIECNFPFLHAVAVTNALM